MNVKNFAVLLILVCAAAPLLTGCATTTPNTKPDLLAFLDEGLTSREQIIMTLGQPSGCYQQEQILTYRLGGEPKQGYYVVEPKHVPHSAWSNNMRYSLVLVLDGQGILKKQSLVSVK